MIFLIMGLDKEFDRFDALLLISLMGAYVLFLKNNGKDVLELEEDELKELEKSPFSWPRVLAILFIGFILVIVGADFTIESASNIARSLGVSEWIIGVILVSMGTSLPELIVSIVASIKGKADMAIGNIIGSNMANITIVLGAAALVKPIEIDLFKYSLDIVTMIVATIMLVFITANKMYGKPAGIGLLIILLLFLKHTLATIS